MVLGIETATVVCAAAVVSDGTVRSEAWRGEARVHAEKLMGLIASVLRESGIGPADLAGVAVSIGPGSFTGLRIGLSVAKGLVYGAGCRLVAVPTLEALAQRAVDEGAAKMGTLIVPVLDARRDEVYCQLFHADAGRTIPEGDARDWTLAALVREIGTREVLVTGDAADKLKRFLQERPEQREYRFAPPSTAQCSAVQVAMIGERLLARGATEDPALLEPRYIKEFFLKTRV